MRSSAILVWLLLCWSAVARAEAPRVVTSVKPLQSLAASVMDGVGVPAALIKGGASPHSYSLRPSEAEALAAADVIFWVGPSFETFLQRPLNALSKSGQVVTLMDIPGLKLIDLRGTDQRDGHIWLDPSNAAVIAVAMAQVLVARDPANATRYRENATALVKKLSLTDSEIAARLDPVKGKPFMVYHDAYQYFDERFGLTSVGAVTVSPERPPGGRKLVQLRDDITKGGVVCVFAEPEFQPKVVEMLAREGAVRTGVLDPEGSTLEPGPDLYFNLMRGLADNLLRCLNP